MLSDEIIEESRSLWSSTIVVVPKPDGSIHLCNNFWRLNQIMKFDSHPLSKVDNLVEHHWKVFIYSLDLTKGC